MPCLPPPKVGCARIDVGGMHYDILKATRKNTSSVGSFKECPCCENVGGEAVKKRVAYDAGPLGDNPDWWR